VPKELTQLQRQRNALAAAVRDGRVAEAEVLRREMAIGVLLAHIHKRLDGLNLTEDEAGLLCAAIQEHTDPESLRATAEALAAQVVVLTEALNAQIRAGREVNLYELLTTAST
jgi:superfamily II RNA helicase